MNNPHMGTAVPKVDQKRGFIKPSRPHLGANSIWMKKIRSETQSEKVSLF